ncbi:MAG: 4'-phosphopantetheinyl transferase superfamily protein, partial [Bacteroidota bacterium]
LLDNAGQLMGFWIMWRKERDRLAFPTRIDRLAFYGPHPAPGEHLECRVDIREAGDIEVTADIELVHNGTVWCTIEGWVGRRFDTDDVIWPTLVYPEKNGVSERQQGGYELCPDRWNTAASRELIARRYLSATEREAWDARGPRSRRGWLMGRLAAKDAVRRWLWDHGDGDRFPVEIAVRNDPEGKPLVDGPFDTDLRVSIAHKNEVGVAIVAEGETPGIDIETIEPRPEEFSSLAFSASELALAHGDDPVEWQTRLWAAKEAAAKAAGTGLGNPRHTTIRQRDGSRLLVESRDGAHRWISTLRHGTHVVAWTDHPPTSP